MKDDIQVVIPRNAFCNDDPSFRPLSDSIINEIESRFNLTLHEIEPLNSGEYAMYELGIGCSVHITTYFNHAIVRLGYGPNNALVYSHCDEKDKPGKIVEAILHCMKQLYEANIAQQQKLLTYIGERKS